MWEQRHGIAAVVAEEKALSRYHRRYGLLTSRGVKAGVVYRGGWSSEVGLRLIGGNYDGVNEPYAAYFASDSEHVG